MNHDTIPKPLLQRKFKRTVKIRATHTLMKAVLNIPWNVSIITCVIEKTRYIRAGGHRLAKAIYTMLGKKHVSVL